MKYNNKYNNSEVPWPVKNKKQPLRVYLNTVFFPNYNKLNNKIDKLGSVLR